MKDCQMLHVIGISVYQNFMKKDSESSMQINNLQDLVALPWVVVHLLNWDHSSPVVMVEA